MRVLFMGATGVVGRRAVPLLVAAGHEVIGTTRAASRIAGIQAQGARAALLEATDAQAVNAVVRRARPEVVVNMTTDLSTPPDFRTMDRSFAGTNLLRTTGTNVLLAASVANGVRRVVTQSFAGFFAEPVPGAVLDETAPFLAAPPRVARETTAALRHLERTMTGNDQVEAAVLRFGPLYGPGTSMGAGGAVIRDVERRRIPIIGAGTGVWSFCHVDDAAQGVALAVDATETGIFNIVDDEPAAVSQWLPELARVIGAPEPRRLPAWAASLVIGGFGMHVMTRASGASNDAARMIGFRPAHASWRHGFTSGLGF